MGYGAYSLDAHEAITQARAAAPREAVFRETGCHPTMDPKGARRECRDSEAHPESIGVIFALDVSGSMGEIPHHLATRTLPTFMRTATAVVPDAQILFVAVGNAYADRSPLQVGQFESEARLIDQWLARLHLEGGGGGLCESYDLALLFAARHTALDCVEKRGRKGYLFLTGDEVPFLVCDPRMAEQVLGDVLPDAIELHALTAEALRSFHVFFLVPDPVRAATEYCGAVWTMLLHERCVVLETPEDTAVACALLLGIQEGRFATVADLERALGELGRDGEERDRVVRVVRPFQEALARGPIALPEPLHRRSDTPAVTG